MGVHFHVLDMFLLMIRFCLSINRDEVGESLISSASIIGEHTCVSARFKHVVRQCFHPNMLRFQNLNGFHSVLD